MALDPDLNPLTPRAPEARLAQRLAFVEEQARAPAPPRVTVPFAPQTVPDDVLLGTTTIILPGNTTSLSDATSCMVDFHAEISFNNVVGGSAPQVILQVTANNDLWSFSTSGGLIYITALPLGTTYRTYHSSPGVVPTPEASGFVPLGGWLTLPLVAGPTTFTFSLMINPATTISIPSGFATIRVNP